MSIHRNSSSFFAALACALCLTIGPSSSFAAPQTTTPAGRAMQLRAERYGRVFGQFEDLIKTGEAQGHTDSVAVPPASGSRASTRTGSFEASRSPTPVC